MKNLKLLIYFLSLLYCIVCKQQVFASSVKYVATYEATVYKDQDEGSKQLITLGYGDAVRVTKVCGEWYRVKCDLGTGYVNREQLTKSVYKGSIKRGGCIGKKELLVADKQYKKIDAGVRRVFENSGWRIFCVDYDLSWMYEGSVPLNGVILGITRCDTNVIYVSYNDLVKKGTLLHEFGHWVDVMSGNASKCSEFEEIYRKELNKLIRASEYSGEEPNVGCASEFFAECYYLMHVTKNFDKVCPSTYKYIKRCESEIV